MRQILSLVLVLALLTFIGCEQNSADSNSLEAQNNSEIQSVLEDSLDLFFDAINDGSEDNFGDDDGTAGLSKTTDAFKLRFGRIATRPVERSVQIIYDTDTTATAYLYVKLSGKFVVLSRETNGDTTNINRFEKQTSVVCNLGTS